MATPFPSFTKTWHTTTYPAIDPRAASNSLSGKTVVITGGGSGIGARTVRSYAEAGSKYIAILGRREKNLRDVVANLENEFPKTKFIPYSVDITDKKALDAVFEQYVAVAGKINVLVSNAGYGAVDGLIKEAKAEDWLVGLDVNIKGSFLLTQAFLRSCTEDATLISVSSCISVLAGPMVSAYATSKAAAVRFFEVVSMENPGLRVISVHPGVVETDMSKKGGATPLDDASLPADYMVWAASPDAAFLNGKYVFVNWDVNELKARESDIKEKKLLQMYVQGLPLE